MERGSETWVVTGGAGFIGSNFVRHALADRGRRVVVLDNLTYAGSLENLRDLDGEPRLRFVRGDIADGRAVAALLSDERPAVVVNFAAESHVDRSIDSPRPFVDTNVVGTFELLEAVRRHLRDLPPERAGAFRLIHVSTDEVFGSLGPAGRFDESSPYDPRSPYAATKAAADHLVRAHHHTFGIPALITNCSNNFGPYQFPEKLVPLMILNAAGGDSLPIYGDGRQVRDWIHVDDHCAGILAAIRAGRPGESYTLGGECERTNLEVVDAICAALERARPAATNPSLAARGIRAYADLKTFVADRAGHDRRYAIDPSKARRDLGWSARRRFDEALDATVRWYLDHADWCAAVQREARYHRERLGMAEGAR
jgi:dTDP-glucose 4,6-dehydratase